MSTEKTVPAGMRAVTKKNVLPVYVIGIVWLLWALLFPLYKFSHFLICGAVSMLAYLIASRAVSDVVTYEKIPEVHTGEATADELLKAGNQYLTDISAAEDSITGTAVREKIDRLKSTCSRIFAFVQEHPKSAGGLRKFMSYYLPTLQKLVSTYALMEKQGVEGENITSSKARIEQMLDTMDTAFEKQLDALFGDTALDIDTDITVMEGMMAKEGLTQQASPLESQTIPDPLNPAAQPQAPAEDGSTISLHF